MPLRLLPDAVRVTNDYLRSVPEVSALVGSRVYTRLPASPVWPLVTINRVAGAAKKAGWLDAPMLQVDVWDEVGQDARAEQVMNTVRAALDDMQGRILEDGFVSSVEEDMGPGQFEDPQTNRPRWTFRVTLTIHPA